jgi:NAD(P)-dependent dehydrogenase (short-subunit alcohol dehydrogenase family)
MRDKVPCCATRELDVMSERLAVDRPVNTDANRMTGKVCLVTGGGSGIGRAAACRMAEKGAAAVVIAGRREAEIESAAAECRTFGARALAVRTDVTREDDVERLVRTVVERYGRLDIAFNNAGFQEKRAPIEQQADSVYDEVFDANVRSVFLCLRHQLPAMFAHGEGRIVINASVSGIRNPNLGLSLYSASKAAVISLMRSAALEAAPRGVRINAIAPGRVVTDMMLRSGVGDIASVAAGLPLRRMGEPDEVAEAVVWLLSDAASYVVGHVLAADGGFLAS